MRTRLLRQTFELLVIAERLGPAKRFAVRADAVAKFCELGLERSGGEDPVAGQRFLDHLAFKARFYRLAHNLTRSPALDAEIEQRWAAAERRGDLSLDALLGEEAEDAAPAPAPEPRYADAVLGAAGQYTMRDGRLVKGAAERREFAVYSNWQGANADPEDIERHRQLLDRQHFGGPFWAGKAAPVSIERELPAYVPTEEDAVAQGFGPGETAAGEQGFAQIKSN